MTHNAKQCIERPRKVAAKYTGKNIGRDEVLVQVELGWEAKRDLWNGYDPAEYKQVIEEYEMREQVRKEHRDRKREEKLKRKKEQVMLKHANGEEVTEKKAKSLARKDSDSSFDLSSGSEDSDKIDEGEADAMNA